MADEPREVAVTVERSRCQGHGRCRAVAPELFALDDWGNAVVLPPGGVVPPALRVSAARAVDNCPEHAVRWVTA